MPARLLDDVDEERDAGVAGTLDGERVPPPPLALALLFEVAHDRRARAGLDLRRLDRLEALDHLDQTRADDGAALVDHGGHAAHLVARLSLPAHAPALLGPALAHVDQHAALARKFIDTADLCDVWAVVDRIILGGGLLRAAHWRRGQHEQRPQRQPTRHLAGPRENGLRGGEAVWLLGSLEGHQNPCRPLSSCGGELAYSCSSHVTGEK